MLKKCSLVVAGFLFGVVVGSGSLWAAEPIRIGFMAPYVGVWTHYGNQMKNGFKLYLDEVGNKVAGREIVVINEDDEGKPDVGLVKARKLVEKDKVHILTGIISSAVAYAVVDYVVASKTPLIIANAGATKLTQEQRNPYVFRTSFANGQQDIVGGWWVAAKQGVKKVVVIGPDYAAGHEKGNGFMKGFKLMGGEVVDEIWAPLGTTDYAPYLAKLGSYVGKADRVWAGFNGADAIRFVNQYAEYGLKEKIRIFCENGVVDESSLPSEGEAALGIEGYMHYAFALDVPENRKFVSSFQKKHGEDPGILAEAGYTAAKAIVAGLQAVKGNIENQDAFLKALRTVKFETARGPFSFDAHQNAIENVYILRVEKRGGKYNNYVIDTIQNVDQYWTPPKTK